jgi:radical SAM protein with 4Fe4S-binding SPASM domain
MNSYQLTKSGLKAISPHVPIRIVLIIDLGSDSFERFFDPIDDFMSSGISIANVTVSGILPRLQDGTYLDSISEYDKLFPLHEVLEKKGYPVYREPPKMGCGLNSNSYFAFDPSGHIVACPAMTPDRQRVYGHASTGIDVAAKKALMKRNFTAACRSCEILPLCSGSCRYEAEAAKNQFDDVYCMHDHIRKVLDQYLLRKAKTSLESLEKEGRLP